MMLALTVDRNCQTEQGVGNIKLRWLLDDFFLDRNDYDFEIIENASENQFLI